MVGFDASFYPGSGVNAVANEIAEAARTQFKVWQSKIGEYLTLEKLDRFEIEMFCIPLPSAEGFREAFLKAMGLSK